MKKWLATKPHKGYMVEPKTMKKVLLKNKMNKQQMKLKIQNYICKG